MGASAYTATLTYGGKQITLQGSDVTTEGLTFPDGSDATSLSPVSVALRDIVFSATGGDTSHVAVYVNGVYTGVDLYKAANTAGTYSRSLQVAPFAIAPGAIIKFIQLT